MTDAVRTSPFRFFRSRKESGGSKEEKVSKKAKRPPGEKKTKKEVLLETLDMSASFDEDPESLIESLQALGDEQPKVARSIPKHSKPTAHEDVSLKNCLFSQDVYDGMLSDSLKMCSILQTHLDDCVTHVRARSPDYGGSSKTASSVEIHSDADSGRGASSPASSPPAGHLHAVKAPLRTGVPHAV